MFWIVPPEPAVVPVPVTVRPPLDAGGVEHDAVGRRRWREMLWNVRPLAPIVVLATLSAVPVPVSIVLPAPVTVTVPPPVALKPAPLVVSMSSPPPVKLIVWPVLVVSVTAVLAPVLSVLVVPLKVVVPAVLPETLMPVPPVPVMLPEKVVSPAAAGDVDGFAGAVGDAAGVADGAGAAVDVEADLAGGADRAAGAGGEGVAAGAVEVDALGRVAGDGDRVEDEVVSRSLNVVASTAGPPLVVIVVGEVGAVDVDVGGA